MKRLICTLLTLLALATATQAQERAPERQNWRHHTLRGDVACVRMKVYTISDRSGTIRQDSLRSWYEWQFNERGDVTLHTSGNTLRETSLKELFTYTAEGLIESVVWHDIEQNREATGEDAQWTGNLFGGMPAYLINVEYPSQIVKGAASEVVGLMGNPTAFIFFAMVAMWLTTLLFKTNRWVGIVAALAYGLSTYTIHIIGAGHITKIWAMVYAPLMVGAVYYTLRRNMWAGAALTALFTSLEIGANPPQITYYFAIPMATLWISEGVFALKERRIVDWLKRSALLIAAGTIALGSNFSPLWQTMQHQKETTRGGSELATAEGEDKGLDLEYMTRWSYGKTEPCLWLLLPLFLHIRQPALPQSFLS